MLGETLLIEACFRQSNGKKNKRRPGRVLHEQQGIGNGTGAAILKQHSWLISSLYHGRTRHYSSMAPSDYIAAQLNGDKDNEFYKVTVDNRPYYPFLFVDPLNEDSLRLAASLVVDNTKDYQPNAKVTKISGGITNLLYRISLKSGNVLVRLFGAEGMIDRNVENATYAALAREGLAPKYYGRFQNGRIEQWLEARPLNVRELSEHTAVIAQELGHFHANFVVPEHLLEYHNPAKPALWTDIHSWMKQALGAKFQDDNDTQRAQTLNLTKIAKELEWLEQDVVPPNAEVAFCHNDALAANILKLNDGGGIQLIDFEYGGINYSAFDIANHFNEYAGGTDTGIPNYVWAPTPQQQETFVREYLKASASKLSVGEMLEQVRAFVMVNHLYWGLWAVNQASTEGCKDFDYLLYASNRINQYYKCKEAHMKAHQQDN